LSFATPVSYPVGEVPWSLAVADFNGDGIPDVVTANLGKFPVDPGQAISVLLGNGDGTFKPESRFGTGRNPYAVAVGDFRGVGLYDIAVANYFSDSVSVLLGNGDGTFGMANEYPVGTHPRALTVGDFNGDGIPDLAVVNYYPDDTVSVLLGKGDGTFAPAQTVAVSGSPGAITAADLTGNGLDDLIVTDDNGNRVEVLRSNGDGTFGSPKNYSVGETPRGVTTADLTGNGVPDLIVTNQDSNTVSVLLGNGDGTFQGAVSYGVGAGPLGVAVGDFNGDRIPDLAVADLYASPGIVSVLLGNGDGTFQSAMTVGAGDYAADVAVGDFNGDGLPDLAVANGLDPSGTVSILLNQGNWSTAPHLATVPIATAPPNHSGQQPPPGGSPFDNVLVNNPAEDGTSRNDTQSETSLVVSGDTVLVAYQDSFTLSANPPQFDGFSSSTDHGQTFTDGGALPHSSFGDLGDPVLAQDSQTGRTYLATISLGPGNVWRSDDNMQTWLAPVNATPSHSSFDWEWLTVDNFAGPGQGNVYLVVHTGNANPNVIYLYRSTDHGATFGPAGGIPIASGTTRPVTGCWVTVGPDHNVYVFWFDGTSTPQQIEMRRSTDQGQTFDPPVTVTTLQTTGASGDLGLGGFRTNAFPQAVVNPVTNQLYVVYDDKGQNGDRADVYFQESDDGGATWGKPIRVVDDTTGADQWQPALAVTSDGTKVGVFWYDRRLDPNNVLIDRFGSIGQVTPDGVVFGPNFRITDTSFPPEFGHDPLIPPNYMGDYDQAVADNQNFYVTWGDNRSPSLGHAGNNADVRFAVIPISATPAGPAVVAIQPGDTTFAPVTDLLVSFNEPVDPTTATTDQFLITDPNGNPVGISAITVVDGSNGMQLDVTFDPPQTTAGTYQVTIGPNITDLNGNPMDQDGDGIGGQIPNDQFFGSFTIVGPSIVSLTRHGQPKREPGRVRVTFDEPVDGSTFTADRIVSFTDPQGNSILVTGIRVVAGSNNTQFDISFDRQTVPGAYTMTIGPGILDFAGNAMTTAYTGSFEYQPRAKAPTPQRRSLFADIAARGDDLIPDAGWANFVDHRRMGGQPTWTPI
jgi:hypothetical protein